MIVVSLGAGLPPCCETSPSFVTIVTIILASLSPFFATPGNFLDDERAMRDCVSSVRRSLPTSLVRPSAGARESQRGCFAATACCSAALNLFFGRQDMGFGVDSARRERRTIRTTAEEAGADLDQEGIQAAKGQRHLPTYRWTDVQPNERLRTCMPWREIARLFMLSCPPNVDIPCILLPASCERL